jgi:hypothetical protein
LVPVSTGLLPIASCNAHGPSTFIQNHATQLIMYVYFTLVFHLMYKTLTTLGMSLNLRSQYS